MIFYMAKHNYTIIILYLFNFADVFKIGSKMSRVTKGIWMYIEEDKIRNLANIFIDVEGFGDPSKVYSAAR
jgi:hypothetical protein